MEIIIDLRENPDESDFEDLNDELEASISCTEEKASESSSDDESMKEKYVILATSHSQQRSTQSRTPIYDFFMLAAGKELGSEEHVLSQSPRRRLFGRHKRTLKNFVAEEEELRRDFDAAREMLDIEEIWAALEYCRVMGGSDIEERAEGVANSEDDVAVKMIEV